MTTSNRPRASLYARLSVQASDANLSLAGMVDDMRAACDRLGFDVAAVHVDDGISGGRRDRPEYQAWLADARQGRADVLMAPHVDRLSREGLQVAAELLDITEGKDSKGKHIYAPVRLMDLAGIDSAHGDSFRLQFVLKAEIARAERERMRDRQRHSQRRMREAGRWRGGNAPYGYMSAPAEGGKGRTLVLHEQEAGAVREAAQRVLRGESLGRVVRWLEHEGHKPRQAKRWSRVSVKQILTGPALLGQLTHGGKPVRDSDGQVLTPFPAVLSHAQHRALKVALADRPSGRGQGRRSRLLSGVITCHACGGLLRVGRSSSNTVSYGCATNGDGGECERPVRVSAERIEEYVTGQFLGDFGHLNMATRKVVVTGGADEVAALDDELSRVGAELTASGDPALFTRLQDLHARRATAAEAEPIQRVETVRTGETLAEWWAGASVEDRRELISSAYWDVILLPGKPGHRGFDPARLILELSHEEDFDE